MTNEPMITSILALNSKHEMETSPLTREELQAMLAGAFHWAAEGEGRDGYLIAFDQDADYHSPNFIWFQDRFDRFVYVDRIVVAEAARGRGLARQFYEDLFATARSAGHAQVVCEVNLDPPNPGSIAFHDAMGFVEVGQAKLGNGKTVSYRERKL